MRSPRPRPAAVVPVEVGLPPLDARGSAPARVGDIRSFARQSRPSSTTPYRMQVNHSPGSPVPRLRLISATVSSRPSRPSCPITRLSARSRAAAGVARLLPRPSAPLGDGGIRRCGDHVVPSDRGPAKTGKVAYPISSPVGSPVKTESRLIAGLESAAEIPAKPLGQSLTWACRRGGSTWRRWPSCTWAPSSSSAKRGPPYPRRGYGPSSSQQPFSTRYARGSRSSSSAEVGSRTSSSNPAADSSSAAPDSRSVLVRTWLASSSASSAPRNPK
ncbi:MAG: hypothetical protein JWR50_4434, partial [Mucilaginibacter sp.]|nr:hypothetical protein [Mucilaginibacter sp.]